MIIHLILASTAFMASVLTFFSGFGLGTILLPVFALFFPLSTAIVMTGIVHFLNGILKVAVIKKHIHFPTLWRFGLFAIPAAILGALLLSRLENQVPLFTYQLFSKSFSVTSLKLVVGVLMIFFTALELLPGIKKIEISPRFLPLGGIISGFFGGLSGHQGAFRSMFLVRAGLTKEQFIATGSAFSFFVDLTRLTVYFKNISHLNLEENTAHLLSATLAATAGVIVGNRLLKKVDMIIVRYTVATMIFSLGVLLASGII